MKRSRDLLILVSAILFILVIGYTALTLGKREAYPPYSTYGTGDLGSKAAYLFLEEMGFQLSRTEESVANVNDDAVLVLIEPDIDILEPTGELASLNEWVRDGHTLVLIGDFTEYFARAASLEPQDQRLQELAEINRVFGLSRLFQDMPYGRGIFRLIPDSRIFTNSGLKEKGRATSLLTSLWDFRDNRLIFDEYGRAGTPEWINRPAESKSPLQLVSIPWRLVILQILLGLAVLGLWTGKGAAPTILLKEEVVREENEDIQAVARLMEQAGLGLEALQLYYDRFRWEAIRYLRLDVAAEDEQLEAAWKQRGLAGMERLREIHACLSQVKKGKKLRDETFIRAFQRIDALREEIKKK